MVYSYEFSYLHRFMLPPQSGCRAVSSLENFLLLILCSHIFWLLCMCTIQWSVCNLGRSLLLAQCSKSPVCPLGSDPWGHSWGWPSSSQKTVWVHFAELVPLCSIIVISGFLGSLFGPLARKLWLSYPTLPSTEPRGGRMERERGKKP